LERGRVVRGTVEERRKNLWKRIWFNGVLKMDLYMSITTPPSIQDLRHAIEKKQKERVDEEAANSGMTREICN